MQGVCGNPNEEDEGSIYRGKNLIWYVDTNPPLKTYFRKKYQQKNKESDSRQTTATAVI